MVCSRAAMAMTLLVMVLSACSGDHGHPGVAHFGGSDAGHVGPDDGGMRIDFDAPGGCLFVARVSGARDFTLPPPANETDLHCGGYVRSDGPDVGEGQGRGDDLFRMDAKIAQPTPGRRGAGLAARIMLGFGEAPATSETSGFQWSSTDCTVDLALYNRPDPFSWLVGGYVHCPSPLSALPGSSVDPLTVDELAFRVYLVDCADDPDLCS